MEAGLRQPSTNPDGVDLFSHPPERPGPVRAPPTLLDFGFIVSASVRSVLAIEARVEEALCLALGLRPDSRFPPVLVAFFQPERDDDDGFAVDKMAHAFLGVYADKTSYSASRWRPRVRFHAPF